MKYLLEVQNLCVNYGPIRALKNVSLSVPKGGMVALVGANGAGKSTLMRAILGIARPMSGDILYEGVSILRKKSHQIVESGIGHAPEGRQIFSDMSVAENLLLGAYSSKMSTAETGRKVDEINAIFPILRERSRQMAGTLSGGEQQMLAIGRALMVSPKLLLLDEPSLGLSPAMTQKIFEVLLGLNKKGTSILLAEQNAAMALEASQWGYVLEIGEIVHEDQSASLILNDVVRKAYLGV